MTSPLKPGQSLQQSATGSKSTLVQSQNPEQPSVQDTESTKTQSFTIPAGSVIEEFTGSNATRRIIISEATPITITLADKTQTRIGAAQKDMAREIGAAMKAMWPVLAVGLLLFVGGGALIYYGWWTKGSIAIGLGLLCMVLYRVIPQYGAMLAVGALGIFAVMAGLILYVYYKSKSDDADEQLREIKAGNLQPKNTDAT